jgi:hypothetical protein
MELGGGHRTAESVLRLRHRRTKARQRRAADLDASHEKDCHQLHQADTPLSRGELVAMGFAVWVDEQTQTAWAQGTHEYRPMGTAVIAITDQFRHRDFRQSRRTPAHLRGAFVGFFGSLETVNEYLRSADHRRRSETPAHLR